MFSEGLGECTKTEVSFELKDDIRLVFKPKKNVTFSALDSRNQELERLKKKGVISKDWATSTGYIRKKTNRSEYMHFSTGLNDCLKEKTYTLTSLKYFFF